MQKSSDGDLCGEQGKACLFSARTILFRCGANHNRQPLDTDTDLRVSSMIVWSTRSDQPIDRGSCWGTEDSFHLDLCERVFVGDRFEHGLGGEGCGWPSAGFYQFARPDQLLVLDTPPAWASCLPNGGEEPNRGPKPKGIRHDFRIPVSNRHCRQFRRRFGWLKGP